MARHREKAAMTEPNQPMVKIYGTRGSAACYSIRDFLHRSDVPFEWIDLTSGEAAGAEAGVAGPHDPRDAGLRLSGRRSLGKCDGPPNYRKARLVPRSRSSGIRSGDL